MQIYSVGGAVRDALLGLPVKDHDYVVVGATIEEMVARGFRPVGKDFPVFLHPHTHEEYALARTERKTAPGYKGFVVHADTSVTLEEDLLRRDLTINAIAKAEDGTLIDPYGGQRDIQAKLFRHVSDAFTEDPVRILRVARFAARFTAFTVAPETQTLMCAMVEQGEVDALVPERVWQELSRGLMEQQPSRMIDVLYGCGALARIVPELCLSWADPAQDTYRQLIDDAARAKLALPLLCAIWMYTFHAILSQSTPHTAQVDAACERLKIPKECRDLAVMLAREFTTIQQAQTLTPEQIVAMLGRCDGYRKPDRWHDMLRAAASMMHTLGQDSAPAMTILSDALHAVQKINAGAIAQQHQHQPQQIPMAVHQARIDAVMALVSSS